MSTEEKPVVEYRAKDGTQIKLSPQIIRKYLVSGRSELVTDQELFIYMGLCKSRGLNPFIKDCYITKFSQNDPAAIITSIDYYRKRARAQKDCKGWTYGIIILGDKGQPVYRNGCLLLDDEKLIGGWAEATPEGWTVPMRKEVNLKRYIKKTKEGVVTRFWSTDNQPEQIAKVAESQMLRAAWPDEFQGLYVDSEIQSRNAQEDLDAAVSTVMQYDTPAPDFNTVFAAELADPLFAEWFDDLIVQSAENYKCTIEKAKADSIKQAEQIKALFQEHKRRLKPAETKPSGAKVYTDTTPETSPPANGTTSKAPAETSVETKEPAAGDFRSEWINLKHAGFSTFVFKNLDRFKAAAFLLRQEAAEKWQKLYPGNKCPFVDQPASENQNGAMGEPQGAAQGNQGGELLQEGNSTPPGAPAVDPAAAAKVELDRLRAEIAMHDKVHRGHAQQARYDLQIALSSTPMNIDGCRVLLERIETILKERPPGNGK
jgi:phage recombination protein Bet